MCWQYCAAAALHAWQVPPPLRPHPACHSLELPLKPLPAAHRLGQVFVVALLLYAVELVLRGHWLVALTAVLLAAVAPLAWHRSAPQDAGAARRLLVAADGSLYVHCIGGATEPATLAGESLWLGSMVLLVLRTPHRTHRLVVGPGNLDGFTLATLRRRLRGAAVGAGDPAVDSRSHPVSSTGPIEQISRGFPA